MSAGAILGGASIGAGVGVSSVALAPFNAANTFLGSAFFGYGMILGERYMYQEDWPKIQQRLVHGEKIENIIQEYTGRFTATVMQEAKIIFSTVTREFIEIMRQALSGEGSILEPVTQPTGGPVIGDPRRTPAPQPPPKPTLPTGIPTGNITQTAQTALLQLRSTRFNLIPGWIWDNIRVIKTYLSFAGFINPNWSKATGASKQQYLEMIVYVNAKRESGVLWK